METNNNNNNDDGFQPMITKSKKKKMMKKQQPGDGVEEEKQQQYQISHRAQHHTNKDKNSHHHNNNRISLSTKKWNKPKSTTTISHHQEYVPSPQEQQQEVAVINQEANDLVVDDLDDTNNSNMEVTETLYNIISNEFMNENNNNMNHDDMINTAIVCMATISLYADIIPAINDNEEEEMKNNYNFIDNDPNGTNMQQMIQPSSLNAVFNNNDLDQQQQYDCNDYNNNDESFFNDRMKNCTLNDLLMNELGEEDASWKNNQILVTNTIDDIVVDNDDEYMNSINGTTITKEQLEDVEENEIIAFTSTTIITNHPPKSLFTNQLMIRGKAPIHIELISFGYHYGVPSDIRTKCRTSYTNPLPPYDCRHIQPIPHYLEWMDGLSNAVKFALIKQSSSTPSTSDNKNGYNNRNYQKKQDNNSNQRNVATAEHDDEDNDDDNDSIYIDPKNDIRYYSHTYITNTISLMLQEAMNEYGYGYSLPLKMKIYIGSEYGKHRSVVICELIALSLRKLLRKNLNHTFISPCSVGCYHREIQKNKQNNNNGNTRPKTTTTTNVSNKNNQYPNRKNNNMKKKGVKDVSDETV